MATLLPILQFLDSDGSALSNGTVTCYQASTTSLQNAYTNQGAGTPLENPILLDTNGRPQTAGQIWLAGNYTLVIKDSGGSLVSFIINNVSEYDPVAWDTLTATIAQLNALSLSKIVGGVVAPSTAVFVDASKNIATFNTLTASNLIANTSLTTGDSIKDANGVQALRLPAIASQVNSFTLTPTVTGSSPTLAVSGSDTNIDFKINSAGTSPISLNTFSMPLTDGTTANMPLCTNASKALAFKRTDLYAANSTATTGTELTAAAVSNLLSNNLSPITNYTSTGLATTITPTSATSTILLIANLTITTQQNSSAVAVIDDGFSIVAASYGQARATGCNIRIFKTIVAGSKIARTYTLRFGRGAATNTQLCAIGFSQSQLYTTAVPQCSFIALELAPAT